MAGFDQQVKKISSDFIFTIAHLVMSKMTDLARLKLTFASAYGCWRNQSSACKSRWRGVIEDFCVSKESPREVLQNELFKFPAAQLEYPQKPSDRGSPKLHSA